MPIHKNFRAALSSVATIHEASIHQDKRRECGRSWGCCKMQGREEGGIQFTNSLQMKCTSFEHALRQNRKIANQGVCVWGGVGWGGRGGGSLTRAQRAGIRSPLSRSARERGRSSNGVAAQPGACVCRSNGHTFPTCSRAMTLHLPEQLRLSP